MKIHAPLTMPICRLRYGSGRSYRRCQGGRFYTRRSMLARDGRKLYRGVATATSPSTPRRSDYLQYAVPVPQVPHKTRVFALYAPLPSGSIPAHNAFQTLERSLCGSNLRQARHQSLSDLWQVSERGSGSFSALSVFPPRCLHHISQWSTIESKNDLFRLKYEICSIIFHG